MTKQYRRWKMSALVVLATAPIVRAQSTRTWTGLGLDNLWGDAANWDTGVPGSGDTGQFTGAGNGNVNVSLAGLIQPINTIAFSGTPAAYTLGVTPGDTFLFDPAGAITVGAGITNGQTIAAAIQTNGALTVTNNALNGTTSGNGLVGVTLNAVTIANGTFTVNAVGTNVSTVLNGNITDVAGSPGSLSLSAKTAGNTNNTNFVINGVNTYTGTTAIAVNTGSLGTIQIATDSPFGTGKVINVLTGGNSPQFQALNGTRTIANALDLNGGITFVGSNSFVLTGPINIINSATNGGRTLNAALTTAGTSVTYGSATNPSIVNLGNPVSNGGDGVGKNAVFAASVGITTIINDVLQNPSATSAGSATFNGAGTILINTPNTYSGTTTLNGAGTILPVQFSSNGTTGAATSGPFGIGAINFNNTSVPHLRPIGNQTLSNPVILTSGMLMDNVTGDASNLTLSGPIALQAVTRFITNGAIAGTSGGTLILGAAGAPSTITLPSPTNTTVQNLSLAALAGPIVVNDAIQNGTMTGNVAINPNANDYNAITLNGASTYTGSTTIGNGGNGGGTILIGVSSVGGPGAVTSGAFGTGTLVLNQTSIAPTLSAVGADRTVANAVTMTSGFTAANSAAAPHSLTFTGPLSLTTAGRVINTNLVDGTTLTLGSATLPSTLTLGTTGGQQLEFQSQSGLGATVVNDLIRDSTGGAGSILVTSGFVQLNNANNSFSGGTTVNGGTLGASSDGALGNAAGAVNVNAGTLLATGTFTSARTLNLSGGALDAAGSNTLTVTGTLNGNLVKGTNAGTVTVAQAAGFTAGSDVNVLGGTLAFAGNTNVAALTVNGSLNVSTGGRAKILPSASPLVSAAPTASINNINLDVASTGTATGTLDLGNTAVTTQTPLNTVRSALLTAYTGGTFSGTAGITSSTVIADASHKSIAYVSGANPANTGLDPSLSNTTSTLIRPALIGDFNIDGKVDRFDIRAFNARNAFNDGLTTHDWADGDLNFDGKVDRFDIRAFNAGNNFNSGVTFAQAQTLTSATPAAISNTTTVGTVGDGKPDLVYNSTTGDVIFKYDGYAPAAGFTVLELDIASSKNSLNANGVNAGAAGSISKGANDIDYQNLGSTPIADGADLGTIFPTGLTPAQLTTNNIVANFFLNGDGSPTKFADVTAPAGVPEPATLSLIGIAAAGLLNRKRRRA